MYPCGGGGYGDEVADNACMAGAELGAGWMAVGPGWGLKIGS